MDTAEERWQRTVPCRDHVGRPRELLVFLTEDDDVGLFAPAGEVAVVHPLDVDTVTRVMREAQREAIHRRGGAR